MPEDKEFQSEREVFYTRNYVLLYNHPDRRQYFNATELIPVETLQKLIIEAIDGNFPT